MSKHIDVINTAAVNLLASKIALLLAEKIQEIEAPLTLADLQSVLDEAAVFACQIGLTFGMSSNEVDSKALGKAFALAIDKFIDGDDAEFIVEALTPAFLENAAAERKIVSSIGF
jgi:hypothetical protein